VRGIESSGGKKRGEIRWRGEGDEERMKGNERETHVVLRNRVRDDQLLDIALIQHLHRLPAQDSVRHQRQHRLRSSRQQVFRRKCEGTARVGHVVDEDGGLAFDVTDEDHASDLVGLFALLVEEGEVEVEVGGH
jgi:hypothetical protein